MNPLNILELRQELHLRKRQQLRKLPCQVVNVLVYIINTVELLPPFTLAQCGAWHFSLHCRLFASVVLAESAPWPHQLLLPDCICFSCYFLIASISVAVSRLCLLQLLLLNCISFSCCSQMRRLHYCMLLPNYVHLWSCTCSTKYNRYKGHASPV